VPICYIPEIWSSVRIVEFCMGIGEERTLAGGRGIAIVGAVTRKPLATD
jgi:hypothetical protein